MKLHCCVLLLMLIVVVYGQRQLSNTAEKHGAVQTISNSSRGKTRYTQTQEYQESVLDTRPVTKSKPNQNRSPTKSETRIVENFTLKPYTTSRGRSQDNRRTIQVTTSVKTPEKNYEVEEIFDDIPPQVADEYHYSRATAERAAHNEAILSAQRVHQQSRNRKQNYQETIDNALQSSKTVPATIVQRQGKPKVVINQNQNRIKTRTNTKSRTTLVTKTEPRIDQSYSRVTDVSQTIKPDSEPRVIEVTENEPDISYAEFLLGNTNKPKTVTSNKRPSVSAKTFDDSNLHYRTGRKIQSIFEPIREVRVSQRSNSRHRLTTQLDAEESTMADLRTPKGRGNKKANVDFDDKKRSKSLDTESINIATSRGRSRLAITDLPRYVSYMKRVEPIPPKPQSNTNRRADIVNETFDNDYEATQERKSSGIILPLMNMELHKTDIRGSIETAASRRTETRVPAESTQSEATYTVRSRNIRSTTEKLNEPRNENSSRRSRGRITTSRSNDEAKQNATRGDVIQSRGSSARRSNEERRQQTSRGETSRSGRRNSENVEPSTFASRGSRRSNNRNNNDVSTTPRTASRRSSKSYDTLEDSSINNNYPDKMPSNMQIKHEGSTEKPSSTTPLSDIASTLNTSKTEQVTAVDKSYPPDNKVTPTRSLESMDQESSEKVMNVITTQTSTVATRGRQRMSVTTAPSASRRPLSRRGRENDRTVSSTSTTLTDAPKSLRRGSVKASENSNLKRDTTNRGRGSVKAKTKSSDDEEEEESDNYPEPFKALLKKKKLVDDHSDGSRPSTSSAITSRSKDDHQHTLATARGTSEKVVTTKVSSSSTTTTSTTPTSVSSRTSRVKLNSSSSGNRYRGRVLTSPKTVSSTSTTERIINEISDDQLFATIEKSTTIASTRSRIDTIKTRRPIANRFVKPTSTTTEKPIIEKQYNNIQRNKPLRYTKKPVATEEFDNNVVPLTNLGDSTINNKYTTPNFNNARQISPTPESTEGTTLSQNSQKKTRNFVSKAKGFQPSKQVFTADDNPSSVISSYKKKSPTTINFRNAYTTQIPQVVAKPSDHKFSARYRSELLRSNNFRVTSTPSYTPTVPAISTSHRNAKNDININDNETDLEILTVIPSNIPKLYSDNLVLDDTGNSTTTTENFISTTEKVTIITPESTSNIATLLTVTTTDNPTEKPKLLTTSKPLITTTQVPKTTTIKTTPAPLTTTTTTTFRTTPKYATINRFTPTTLATPTPTKKVEIKREEAKMTTTITTTQTTPTTIIVTPTTIKQFTPTYTTTVKSLITEKIYTAESAPPNILTTLLSNYINNPTVTTKFPETTRSYSTVSELKSIVATTTQSSTENVSTIKDNNKDNVAQQTTTKSKESENLVVKNLTPTPMTSTTLSPSSIISALRAILQNNFPQKSSTSLSISNLSLLPNTPIPTTTTTESETQAQFSLDTASSESSTSSIQFESTTVASTTSSTSTILTTSKLTTTPTLLTTPKTTSARPSLSTTTNSTPIPKSSSSTTSSTSTAIPISSSSTTVTSTTSSTSTTTQPSSSSTTSSTITTTQPSVTTTLLPPSTSSESLSSSTTQISPTSTTHLTSLPSSTSTIKPHTAYPTAWAPPGYVPRFATRPSIALLGTLSSSTSTTTPSSQNDYYVFGILPNNTVVRKKPRFLSATTSSPFIVFGIFPNNTIVRKYPNGTIVPDDNSSDVEITDLSANNLKYSLQTGINITTSSEATNNIMITTSAASTSTTTTNSVNTLLNQEDNIQDNLIDNTVRKISPSSFTNPESSASTHILSLTTTKAPRTTESLEVKQTTTIPPFMPLEPKLPTLAEILGPKVVEAYKEILNETRTNRTTNEIERPISVFDINRMEKTLKDNPVDFITTIRPVTVNWKPIQGVPFTAVPASAYYNATSSSTTSTSTTTTSKSQMIDFIENSRPQGFTPTTTFSSASQTTEQFLSTKSETIKPSTTTVRHTTPRPTRTRHKTTTTTPKPTTEKPTPSTRRTTTTQRRPAKVPVTTVKVIETTVIPTTLKTVSSSARPKKTTQLPLKEQSLQDELAFLNSLREASSVITQKPSKEQEDLANRIISLAIGNQNKPTTSTTKPQESSIFNLLEVPRSISTTTSRTPKNVKTTNNNNQITPDEIKTFQQDLEFLKLLQDSGLAGTLGSVTKAPVLSTTYGKSNEALLAALLKDQGIGPAVSQNQLLQDLQLAALLDQIVTPAPKPRPKPKPTKRRPTTTTQRPIFGLFQGVRNWLAGAFIGPESQYPQQQQSRRPSLAAVAVRPRPRPSTTTTEDPFEDDFVDFSPIAPQKPSSSTVKTVKRPALQSAASPNIFSEEFDDDVTILKERPRSIRPNTKLEEIPSTEKPRTRKPKSRKITTTTASPFGSFDEEEIIDDEPPQQVRGQLVDAAINVTKAFSKFLGAAIQGAASTFQNFLNSGTRNFGNYVSSGSIG